jgi:hypothetical protein
MGLASRLLNREFYDLFQNTVTALADRMAMNLNINYDLLFDVHEQWKSESDKASPNESNIQEFVTTHLGNIAVALCKANCVTYSNRPDSESDADAFHRSLLEEFASEYTAMEFVRARHMEFYFAITKMPHVQLEPALVNEDPHSVARTLAELRTDPELAEQYARLLHLPTFSDSESN